MSNALGLTELLFVLLGAMSWGVYELWSLGRTRKRKGGSSRPGDDKD